MKNICSVSKNSFYFVLFLLIGLLIFTFPMLKSGFDLMPGDGQDAKAINCILEHSWLWLNRVEPNYYLWSPPFNYDSWFSLALSDSMLGVMPIYWLFRVFFNSFASFQMLTVVLCFLNYFCFYYLLRQIKYSRLASSVGAFVFAFCIFRYFKMIHLNFYTQFFSILAIIFFLKLNKNNTCSKNHMWFLLSSVCIILQFYSCYTLGFYFLLVLFFGLFFGLLPKTSRDIIIEFFKNFYKMFLFYLFVVLVMLIPLSYFNIMAGNYLNLEDTLTKIATTVVWFRNVSILDNIFMKNITYVASPLYTEINISFGYLTMLFAFFAISKVKFAKGVPILVLLFIYMASCNIPAIILWKFFYLIPGGEFIKSISRISFIALIVVAFLIADFIKYLETKEFKIKYLGKIFLVCSILLIVLEAVPYNNDLNSDWKNYSWSKKEFIEELNTLKQEVPQKSRVISIKYLPIKLRKYGFNDRDYKKARLKNQENINAMWLSLLTHKYTINCYPQGKNEEDKSKIETYTVERKYDVTKL